VRTQVVGVARRLEQLEPRRHGIARRRERHQHLVAHDQSKRASVASRDIAMRALPRLEHAFDEIERRFERERVEAIEVREHHRDVRPMTRETFDALSQRAHGGKALVGLLRHRASHDRFDTLGHAHAERRERRRVVEQDLRDQRVVAVRDEGRTPREQLKEHRAERIHVGAAVDVDRAAYLLGRHEVRRPDRIATTCEREAGLSEIIDGHHLRDAEVEQLHLRRAPRHAREEDVLRLEIAMHDTGRVRRLDAGEHLSEEIERRVHLERSVARERRRERLAVEELHHDVRVRRWRGVEHVDHVRMADATARERFLHEALAGIGVARDVVAQHLDGDAATGAVVPRLEDRAHAADAERAHDLEVRAQYVAGAQRRMGRDEGGSLDHPRTIRDSHRARLDVRRADYLRPSASATDAAADGSIGASGRRTCRARRPRASSTWSSSTARRNMRRPTTAPLASYVDTHRPRSQTARATKIRAACAARIDARAH
jgi:hypothetical protein